MSTLAEVMARTYAAQPQEPLIDGNELARLLGFKSANVVRQIRDREGWPFVRIGRTVRYRYSEVLAACENQPQREPSRMQRKETP